MGELITICAWCKKKLERKKVDGPGGISHGICTECRKKHIQPCIDELERKKRAT